MIESSGLTKRYGAVRALDRVSFEVNRGEIVGFLGPNGAGKSTTMRILTCFISATEGSAKVHGFDVFDDPLEVRKKIGYLPQRAPLYNDMSVWEYLSFVADMRSLDRSTFKKRMKGIVEVCGLARMLGRDIRHLSHGYRQRVGLAQALVHDPPILILDEPTSDLDPNEKAEVIRYIKELGKERTILLSTHNLSEVEAACQRAIIVSKGRVVADGPLEELRGKSGKIRYVVTLHSEMLLSATSGYRGGAKTPPSPEEVIAAFQQLPGVRGVTQLATKDASYRFQISANEGELRPAIFGLVVDKGWLLLELRQDSQSLEDVFKLLTKGDEHKDRGRHLLHEEHEEDDEPEADEEGDSDEETSEDDDASDEDLDEGDDEGEGDEPSSKKD